MSKPVVIIGSGFAGLSCAFHLARAGHDVRVIERKDQLGGYFRELQKQFPTNSCGACFMHPDYPAYCPHIECQRFPNITSYLSTTVTDVAAGDESVVVTVRGPQGEEKIDACALVLATGCELFDIAGKPELGGGVHDTVFSALAMERMIYDYSATGIKPPFRSLAYVQCVGSRDVSIGRPHCSAFCCMYALKQAMMLKEMMPDLDIAIFYMDMRTFGKNYERYYRDAVALGIRFIRSAVASVVRRPSTGKLELLHACNGKPAEEVFDAVVLSQGAAPDQASCDILRKLGTTLDLYATDPLTDSEPVPNVFVAGSAFEPMDIPDSVVDGIAVASRILERHEPRSERDATAIPRPVKVRKAGVACVAVDEETYARVKEQYETAVRVQNAGELGHFITAGELEGCVVVAGDMRVLEAAVRERSNFGLQVSSLAFVPAAATALNEEIEAALYRIRNVRPGRYQTKKLSGRVLVVGAGIAGLAAARKLARLGTDVLLIEKSGFLGGRLRGMNQREVLIQSLITAVENEGRVEILKGFELKQVTGRFGEFSVVIESGAERRTASVDSILLATGGRPRVHVIPCEDNPRVFTFFDIDRHEGLLGTAKNVAMLQCAGSRTDENPVCYRVCCTKAVENAKQLKEKHPDMNVWIFHRDIRTYGYRENLYREARRLGVRFVRIEADPVIESNASGVTISITEEGTGSPMEVAADYLLLSTGLDPDTRDVAGLLGVKTTDGFLAPYNSKAGVLDIAPGIYAAGIALAPSYTPDAVKQAEAAALRAHLKIAARQLVTRFDVAFVNEKYCCGCELCVTACPVSARYMDADKKVAMVDETLCEGCGTCAMVCANKASQHRKFEHKSMLKTIDVMIG